MKETIVFIASTLLWMISLSHGRRGYVLTSPKVIDADSTEYFALTLFDIPNGGSISLRLLKADTDEVVAETTTTTQNKHNMWIEMYVPPVKYTSARLHIRGTFSSADGYQINAVKEVRLRHKSVIIFLQTDKPIYKPGQTVKFRILPMDSQLRPLQGQVVGDIWIEDPVGVRVAQWKSVAFSDGIVQLSLPLSEEPVLGRWTILSSIRNISHSQTFSVEEYVIPKFEVLITPPSYVLADAESIDVKICAQYTYGKKVEGSLKAKITYRKQQWERNDPVVPSVEYEGMISGCYSFHVATSDLLLHKKEFSYRPFEIFAEVIENGTEVKQNASVTLEISQTPLVLKFLGSEKGSHFFKPGLPFYGTLQVLKPDHTAAASEEVSICAKLKKRGENLASNICRTFTSSGEGLINFLIPPQDATIERITLQANARYSKQLYEPSASISLQAWFSPSGSHLQIEPITKKVKCEKLEQVTIRYTADTGATIKFYHQVISRGRIVQQGSHQRTFYATENDLDNDYNLLVSRKTKDDGSQKWIRPQSNTTELSNVGEFILSFNARATMSPLARLLVFYVRTDGEVVADSKEFRISHCLQNKARLHFRHERQYPGTEASLLLAASPSSLCGIGLVDKSVHLLRSAQLDKQKVFNLLKTYDVDRESSPRQISGDYCRMKNFQSQDDFRTQLLEEFGRQRRSLFPSHYHIPRHYQYYDQSTSGHADAITAFEEAGMVVLSDMVLETRPCYYPPFPRYELSRDELYPLFLNAPTNRGLYGPVAVDLRAPSARSNSNAHKIEVSLPEEPKTPKSVTEIRNYFPETWLWELHKIGESGEMTFKRELPHTITEWVGSAVCMHPETGLGISEPSKITTFQPFFVSFSLPYSVIRDELVPLTVTVFNYLTECLPIKLSLEPSEMYKLISESRIHKLCVCGGKSKTHKFLIRPTVLGKVNVTVHGYSLNDDSICENEITARLSARDAVTRQLLVEAEGFPKEQTLSNYFCPQHTNGTFISETDLLLPEDVVDGSARAYLSVTGDLMGPTFDGLDRLVRLPVGCGEQNMVLFTPNIFVLDYLRNTNKVSREIEDKALGYMKTGYQRELRYRHKDGSYSAFGDSDPEGSMWLTAFVVKSFAQAQRFIYVDEKDLSLSTNWIVKKQFENGCFEPVGSVHHSGMKGGLGSKELTLAPLTAYVLIALLEAGYERDHVVNSAIYCLQSNKNPDIYSLSLFAYATALANDTSAEDYLRKLEERSVREGNSQYWESGAKLSRSVGVEIAGYAVLAMLKLGGAANVPKAFPVIQWITKQRNSNGGFVSTQDTVVALQTLAKYASYSSGSQLNITMTVENEELVHEFNINEANKLVMQTLKIPAVPSGVDIQAIGEGCALSQLTLKYNVQSIPGTNAFDLHVVATRVGSSDCNTPSVGICARYKVPKQRSNMIVIEIKMVSGYLPDEWSLHKLKKDDSLNLKRYEIVENQINFYFSELTNDQKCFNFLVKHELEIENAKPASVKLYDYYQPEFEVTTTYEIPSTCLFSPLPELPTLPPLENDDNEEAANLTDVELSANSSDDDNSIDSIVPLQTINLTNNISHELASNTVGDDIELSDSDSQQINSSHLHFFEVDHDLDFPEGLEANEPLVVLPDRKFVSSEPAQIVYNGCPVCSSEFPTNFSVIYCSAAFALRMVVRDSDSGTVKIVHDISADLPQPLTVQKFGSISLDKSCSCPLKNGEVLLLTGSPASLWNSSSSKHIVKLTSDVNVISVPPKPVQPHQLKSARNECRNDP